MKRYLPFIIVGAVAALTVGATTMLYRAKRPSVLGIPKNETTTNINAADVTHVFGRMDAPVTIEEFGDFQCPPCGTAAEPLNQLVRDFPRLRLVFRNYPLPVHQHANIAALAAEAAGMQGHFWEMHDLLFKEQANWSKASNVDTLFNAYATMLRLDVNRFHKDMASKAAMERIKSDHERGGKLGVTVTPTIFLNNQSIPPASLGPKEMRAAVEAMMKKTSAKN
jgi:protein-disulfide isomerase